MSDNEQRERTTGPLEKLEAEREPASNPPANATPTIPPKKKKPGPSIDIGPGPGADVVATPPRRLGGL